MLRITAGEWRGRPIRTPKTQQDGVRPSQAKLRQALFNSIQNHLPDARVVDLFAGPGTLGLEALSRGAAHVTFVENLRPCLQALSENLKTFEVHDRGVVLGRGVEAWMKSPPAQPWDIVLADPPYKEGWEMRLLHDVDWQNFLAPGGLLVMEWGILKSKVSELPASIGVLVKVREKNYGDSCLTTFQCAPSQKES